MTTNKSVVHFPRHLARPPERPLELPEYLERKYELTFNEPWAALEERVRARHPYIFEMVTYIEEPKKMWWEFWK